MKITLAVVLAAAAVAAASPWSKDQFEARFYYDLGPAEVDVSGYPVEQQANYVHFQANCSICHTLARPINAPLVKREDWRRYVKRMHMKAKVNFDMGFARHEGRDIIDFLVYDADVRKVKGKAEFEALTRRLQDEFRKIQKERAYRQAQADQKKVKDFPSGAVVNPQPKP